VAYRLVVALLGDAGAEVALEVLAPAARVAVLNVALLE
jgi:hypothetical protein